MIQDEKITWIQLFQYQKKKEERFRLLHQVRTDWLHGLYYLMCL